LVLGSEPKKEDRGKEKKEKVVPVSLEEEKKKEGKNRSEIA